MTTAIAHDWPVLPHDPMHQLADNLWWVEGDLPKMKLRRAMTIARLQSGDLVIHNAVALSEAGMRELEALGRPAWLVVPNGWHRLDAARFKARYPAMKVICPAGSRAKVEEKVAVDTTFDETPQPDPGDPSVRFTSFGAEDVKRQEGAMLVRSTDGLTTVLTDVLFNLDHQKGLFWWFYGRVLGATGGPRVTLVARLLLVKGGTRKAFKGFLNGLQGQGVVRIVPGHGAPIKARAGEVAREVAATL